MQGLRSSGICHVFSLIHLLQVHCLEHAYSQPKELHNLLKKDQKEPIMEFSDCH